MARLNSTSVEKRHCPRAERSREAGFGLVEVLLSMILLTVSLVGLLTLYTQSLVTMDFSQEDLIVKQKAREALESIYTARNTQQISFDMIQNASNGGILLDGPQELRDPGGDGLVGTADDGAVEVMLFPGPDGDLGTADDVLEPLNRFRREIQVDPIAIGNDSTNPDLKRIRIILTYTTLRGSSRTFEVESFISRFR